MHDSPLAMLEFICNLRWLLSYALGKLDPVVEAHYINILEQARGVAASLAHSFISSNLNSSLELNSLNYLKLIIENNGALTLAQEGVVYLLVAEGVLGHCPPTMHSFLIRATAPLTSSLISDNNNNSISSYSTLSQLYSATSIYQAQFLCIRWLVTEGLLTDEELFDALSEADRKSFQGVHQSRFELHVYMAKCLSNGNPFALELHVMITRALLLYHCSTLISVDNIISHVRFLDPMCSGEMQSMEDSLMFWIRHIIKLMYNKKIINNVMYNSAMNEISDSIYNSLHSGILLGLVVHFYKPELLLLENICIVNNNNNDNKSKSLMKSNRLKNWGEVLRVSEELGMCPNLYADEVEKYGSVVLQFHVLYFLEELFAVLATHAEDLEEHSKNNLKESLNQNSIKLNNFKDEKNHRNFTSTEKVENIVNLQRQGVVESPRENVNESFKSSNEEINNNNNNNSLDGYGDKVNGNSSLNSSFPSDVSRRQYDVMMASLHLRGFAIHATAPLQSHSSPQKSRTSFKQEEIILKEENPIDSAAMSLSTRTVESFPSEGILLSKNVCKNKGNNNIIENNNNNNNNKLKFEASSSESSLMMNDNKTNSCDSIKNSFTVLPNELIERGSNNRYAQASLYYEQKSNFLSPPIVKVIETNNNNNNNNNNIKDLKTEASCSTTESSFHIKSLQKPNELIYSTVNENNNNNNNNNGNKDILSIPVVLSRPPSPVLGQSEEISNSLSPLTPDIMTEQNLLPLQISLKSSISDKAINYSKLQNKYGNLEVRWSSETGMREILNEISALDPIISAATGDRQTLLRALEAQQTLIQRLTRKLTKKITDNYPWRDHETLLSDKRTSSVNQTIISREILRLSENSRLTDDSGQYAETDISSVIDDFIDKEGSFLEF